MDDLSKLPAPPKGQTGISLDQFQHLPPPPKGQTGMTLAQVQAQPIAKPKPTLASAGRDILDIGKGFVKGVGRTLGGVQDLGKSALGAVGIDTSNMGIKPLDNIQYSNESQKVGGGLETVAELGSGLIGDAFKARTAIKTGLGAIESKIAEPLVNKLTSKIETKAIDKTANRALESITPSTKELTPTEYQDLLGKNKISPKTATSPAQYILSESEKANAMKYQDLLQNKDPVKNSINVINKIADTDKKVGTFLRANNGTFNNGELKNYIVDKLKDVTDISIPEERIAKLKDTMASGFVNALPKNDMESLWKARKAFDQSIEKVFGGSPTLQNTVKKEFRNSIQDFIAERTPDGKYKQAMQEMRTLFNLQDTIATKASKEKTLNGIYSWMKNNPIKAKVIGGLAGYEVARKTGLLP